MAAMVAVQPTNQTDKPRAVDQDDVPPICLPGVTLDCAYSILAVKAYIKLTSWRGVENPVLWLPCSMLHFICSCSGEDDLHSSIQIAGNASNFTHLCSSVLLQMLSRLEQWHSTDDQY